MKPMMPYESFLQGIKPACFEVITWLKPEVLGQLEKYPYHYRNENEAIFFQNEAMKYTFIQETEGLSIKNPLYQKILGNTLGFPPKAVDFYSHYYGWQLTDREEAERYFFTHKVGFRHMGVMCEGHIEDIEENAKWLWARYPSDIPLVIKAIQKPDNDLLTFPVDNGDFSGLQEAKQKVQAVLDHNKQVMAPVLT
ncbi:hypothetical protein [Risungbinella massiliensis]|uniref:hypothetical protein n=1 Tax=Risungbinella massiliensis TaxID=1329796 RepID=UPI0005CBB08B|nr:hypothetical protein [Risungbinella massiliensis]